MTSKQYVKKEKILTAQFCRKKTDNEKIRGVTLVNKKVTQRSLCTDCISRKSAFLKAVRPITNKTNKKQKQFSQVTKTWKPIAQNVKSIPIMYVQKKLTMMTNIKIRGISRCADCLAHKSLLDKIKDKDQLEVIVSEFLID